MTEPEPLTVDPWYAHEWDEVLPGTSPSLYMPTQSLLSTAPENVTLILRSHVGRKFTWWGGGKRMDSKLPQSILFCCDHNAVRSPMAEGIMKKLYGTGSYVQSVGVVNDLEIDGFSIAVCEEIEVQLSRHRSRSFDEMKQWGDDLSSFDLVVALSPASQRRALELTRLFHLTVEYWPILDPTGIGETREMKLVSYRQTRDQIVNKLKEKWGNSS